MHTHVKAVLFAACVAAAPAALAQDAMLEIRLAGVQHERGNIRVGLYVEPGSFRKEAQAFAVNQVPAAPGIVRVTFGPLAPGRYAVMAYHDEDGNGELNRRFGMFPTEGYGLSNNPTVSGPPAFEDSAFDLAPGPSPTEIHIDLRY